MYVCAYMHINVHVYVYLYAYRCTCVSVRSDMHVLFCILSTDCVCF